MEYKEILKHASKLGSPLAQLLEAGQGRDTCHDRYA